MFPQMLESGSHEAAKAARLENTTDRDIAHYSLRERCTDSRSPGVPGGSTISTLSIAVALIPISAGKLRHGRLYTVAQPTCPNPIPNASTTDPLHRRSTSTGGTGLPAACIRLGRVNRAELRVIGHRTKRKWFDRPARVRGDRRVLAVPVSSEHERALPTCGQCWKSPRVEPDGDLIARATQHEPVVRCAK